MGVVRYKSTGDMLMLERTNGILSLSKRFSLDSEEEEEEEETEDDDDDCDDVIKVKTGKVELNLEKVRKNVFCANDNYGASNGTSNKKVNENEKFENFFYNSSCSPSSSLSFQTLLMKKSNFIEKANENNVNKSNKIHLDNNNYFQVDYNGTNNNNTNRNKWNSCKLLCDNNVISEERVDRVERKENEKEEETRTMKKGEKKFCDNFNNNEILFSKQKLTEEEGKEGEGEDKYFDKKNLQLKEKSESFVEKEVKTRLASSRSAIDFLSIVTGGVRGALLHQQQQQQQQPSTVSNKKKLKSNAYYSCNNNDNKLTQAQWPISKTELSSSASSSSSSSCLTKNNQKFIINNENRRREEFDNNLDFDEKKKGKSFSILTNDYENNKLQVDNSYNNYNSNSNRSKNVGGIFKRKESKCWKRMHERTFGSNQMRVIKLNSRNNNNNNNSKSSLYIEQQKSSSLMKTPKLSLSSPMLNLDRIKKQQQENLLSNSIIIIEKEKSSFYNNDTTKEKNTFNIVDNQTINCDNNCEQFISIDLTDNKVKLEEDIKGKPKAIEETTKTNKKSVANCCYNIISSNNNNNNNDNKNYNHNTSVVREQHYEKLKGFSSASRDECYEGPDSFETACSYSGDLIFDGNDNGQSDILGVDVPLYGQQQQQQQQQQQDEKVERQQHPLSALRENYLLKQSASIDGKLKNEKVTCSGSSLVDSSQEGSSSTREKIGEQNSLPQSKQASSGCCQNQDRLKKEEQQQQQQVNFTFQAQQDNNNDNNNCDKIAGIISGDIGRQQLLIKQQSESLLGGEKKFQSEEGTSQSMGSVVIELFDNNNETNNINSRGQENEISTTKTRINNNNNNNFNGNNQTIVKENRKTIILSEQEKAQNCQIGYAAGIKKLFSINETKPGIANKLMVFEDLNNVANKFMGSCNTTWRQVLQVRPANSGSYKVAQQQQQQQQQQEQNNFVLQTNPANSNGNERSPGIQQQQVAASDGRHLLSYAALKQQQTQEIQHIRESNNESNSISGHVNLTTNSINDGNTSTNYTYSTNISIKNNDNIENKIAEKKSSFRVEENDRKITRLNRPDRSPISLQRQTNVRLMKHRQKIQQQRQEQLAQLALRSSERVNNNNNNNNRNLNYLTKNYQRVNNIGEENGTSNSQNRSHHQRISNTNNNNNNCYYSTQLINGHESLNRVDGLLERLNYHHSAANNNNNNNQNQNYSNKKWQTTPPKEISAQQTIININNNNQSSVIFNRHQQALIPTIRTIANQQEAIEICDNQLACSSSSSGGGDQIINSHQLSFSLSRNNSQQNRVINHKMPLNAISVNQQFGYHHYRQQQANKSYLQQQQQQLSDEIVAEDDDDNKTISSSESTYSLNKPFCKICHVGSTKSGDKLISPCRCSGTMQYIHCGCLLKWLEISNRTNEKPISCELCAYEYTWHKKFNYKHLRMPRLSLKDLFLHIIFVLSICVMLFSALAPMLMSTTTTTTPTTTTTTMTNTAKSKVSPTTQSKSINSELISGTSSYRLSSAAIVGSPNDINNSQQYQIQKSHSMSSSSSSSSSTASGKLANDEKLMLICAASFFISFFLAIYVQTKTRDTLYSLIVKFIHMNQTFYITEYDHGQLLSNNNNDSNDSDDNNQKNNINIGAQQQNRHHHHQQQQHAKS